jgi:hypothetical protein
MSRSSLKFRLPTILVLISVVASLGANPASTAVEKVREGIRYFFDGEFGSADKSFTEADEAEPDNATIAFDRACALAVSGDAEKVEEARKFFRDVAMARDVGLAARAHYNLGTLSAEQGRATLGEDPVEAPPEKREEGVSQLVAAVGHYRDCLKLENGHSDARHNLELIRLFIKHIQDQWAKRDREKAREEKGLLEFLAMIEQRQTELRSAVRVLSQEQDSPQRRQAAAELSDSQTELRDEIEPLKEKIAEELAAAQQTSAGNGAPQDPNRASQMEQAQTLLQKIADEAGSKMEATAAEVSAATFSEARAHQLESLDRLNEIYMAVAPFTAVLQRATKQQEQLTETSETLTGFEDEANGGETSDSADDDLANEEGAVKSPVEIDLPDDQYPELAQQQSRVTDWSRMLSLKAQAELPQIETQLQAAKAQSDAATASSTPVPEKNDASKGDDENEGEPSAKSAEEDALARLEGMKASLEKAIELGPKVEEHSRAAVDSLQATELAKAMPDQQEALRLLREIAEPLKNDDQQQSDEQQNQDQQDEDGDKGKQNQQSQNDQPLDNPDQQKQQDQKQKEQSQRERAMSALRRAREREREHRDLQKQLQQLIGGRIRVDRDW